MRLKNKPRGLRVSSMEDCSQDLRVGVLIFERDVGIFSENSLVLEACEREGSGNGGVGSVVALGDQLTLL